MKEDSTQESNGTVSGMLLDSAASYGHANTITFEFERCHMRLCPNMPVCGEILELILHFVCACTLA